VRYLAVLPGWARLGWAGLGWAGEVMYGREGNVMVCMHGCFCEGSPALAAC
jgi:hypothetical protein